MDQLNTESFDLKPNPINFLIIFAFTMYGFVHSNKLNATTILS
jgi:hypothetical protein